MTKRDIEYNVPLRLPIPGEDTEAMFRRLVAFSYAVGRQYRADGGPAEEPGAEASRFVREELARPSEAEQAQIREITRPSPLLDQYSGYGAREAVQQNVSRPMPTAHEFVQHQLKGNEPQLPQMDREAYQRMKEYSVLPLELAAYEIPVAGQALAAVDLARSIGDLGSALRTGDKADVAGSAAEAGMAASGTRGKLAKMAAATMAGLMPEEAEAGTVGKALRAIRAYHGSPYAFDRFDLSKIGTGEGAQKYGHGLYFAEREPVARDYLGNSEARYKRFSGHMDPKEEFAFDLATNSNDPRDMDIMMPLVKKYGSNIDFDEAQKLATDAIKNRGHMYEVDIHADPEHFLDWDAYLSDQSPILQKAVRGIAETSPLRDNINAIVRKDREAILRGQGPISGKNIYENLGGYSRPQETSEALREAGIPGIKYLDAGSRATGEGSRNYVIFDDKRIDILRRYAQGGDVDGYAGGGEVDQPDSGIVSRALNLLSQLNPVSGAEAAPINKNLLRSLAEIYRSHYDPTARISGMPTKIEKGKEVAKDWFSRVQLSKPLENMMLTSSGHRPMVAERFMEPQDLAGKGLVSGFGDRTPAGYYLTGLNGRIFKNPVNMGGGPAYARDAASLGPDRAIWASEANRAQALANKAKESADRKLEPVFTYIPQGPESGDFSHHMKDIVLNQLEPQKMNPDLVSFLNKRMKEAQTGSGETFAPKPEWVGLESPDMPSRLAQRADERVKLIKLMDALKIRDAPGFADIGASRFASTDPAVMFDPTFSAGKSFMAMDPSGKIIKNPEVTHPSYNAVVPAAPGGHGYLGRFEYEIPPEIHFKNYLENEIKKDLRGKPFSQQTMSLMRQAPIVEATPEWVDTASEWQELMKSLYGRRRP